MAFTQTLVLLMSAWLVSGQRPSFAGTKPIGYPELTNKPSTGELLSRFGDGTPLILPIEAKGDRDLVLRISKLPVDQQPFWYINWKALEQNRKNPQTYEQRSNSFIDSNTAQDSDNLGFDTNDAGFENSNAYRFGQNRENQPQKQRRYSWF